MLSGGLLPLDRGWRLGGDVVDAAIDAVHRIDDLTRDACEEVEHGFAPVEVPDFTRGAWQRLQGYHHYMIGD